MKLKVRSNSGDVLKVLHLRDDQAAYAQQVAINNTAKRVQAGWQGEIKSVFDRPTAFTQNAPMISRFAKKDNLVAEIKIRDRASKGTAPAKYLAPQILGGQRKHKRFESALLNKGIMRLGEYAVPGKGFEDEYGNLKGSVIVQILSHLQAFGEQGYRANITADRRRKLSRGTKSKVGFGYFYVRGTERDQHLARGIWYREGIHGVDLKPVVLFVKGVSYQKRFDPIGSGQKIVDEGLPIDLENAVEHAMSTAR